MGRARTGLLAIVALVALSLVGCGGGGGASTSFPTPPAPRPATSATGQKGAVKPAPKQKPSSAPLPDPTPGSKAAAPGVPTSKQGDNSIQTWGFEAPNAERAHLTAIVQAYLNARAAGHWARACSRLGAKPRAEQRRAAQGASCATAMKAFTPRGASAALAEEAKIEVLSLRVGGGYAFLIYRRPDGKVYAMPLTREGGGWRLSLVTPTPLE